MSNIIRGSENSHNQFSQSLTLFTVKSCAHTITWDTSALDSESEKSVQDALHNLMKHRTTFMIAHRLSTIAHAHSIIVLDKGEIVEVGTHEKLISTSGLYKKYYEMQMR